MACEALTRRAVLVGMAGAPLIGNARHAAAQQGPGLVTLVVPFAAGGSADIMARIVGQQLAQRLKTRVVIDNRAGAGGNLAASYVAKARPDGSVLLWGTISTHALNPLISKALPYDPVTDFTPVSLVATLPNVMLVNPKVPARTVAEIILLIKFNPGAYSFASSGVGTPLHLSGELFNLLSGANIRHVPYRGAGPALNDVIAGHVPLMFDTLASATQHMQSGALRALAVTTKLRSPIMPDLPTMEEAGLAGYETYAWHALFCPAGTPERTASALAEAVRDILGSAEVLAKLQDLGAAVQPSTPDELADHVRAELAKWRPIVKSANALIE